MAKSPWRNYKDKPTKAPKSEPARWHDPDAHIPPPPPADRTTIRDTYLTEHGTVIVTLIDGTTITVLDDGSLDR